MLQMEPAARVSDPQLWWLAATIARRHPQLRLVEAIKPPDAGDALTLVRGDEWVTSIDNDGRLWAGDFAGASLARAFEAEQPIHTVELVERMSGLNSPGKTPAATPHTLMYRVAAALVATTANDRVRLRVRAEWAGMDGDTARARGGVRHFPQAMDRIAPDIARGSSRWMGQFWLVERGNDVVAAMDTDGRAYLPGRELAMPEIYAKQGRKVIAVLHTCFASLLS